MTQDNMDILKVEDPPAKTEEDGDDKSEESETKGEGGVKKVAFS